MSEDTKSSNWGTFAIATVSGQLGLGVRGTIYVFRNFDTDERFLFLLTDLGFGLSVGFKVPQVINQLVKAALSGKSVDDPASYTMIPVNNEFSASDLNLAPGAEATIGVTVFVAGSTTTLISAWPFFSGAPEPGVEVNNDYFTGAQIVSQSASLGLNAAAAYQFMGRWIKLWSL